MHSAWTVQTVAIAASKDIEDVIAHMKDKASHIEVAIVHTEVATSHIAPAQPTLCLKQTAQRLN